MHVLHGTQGWEFTICEDFKQLLQKAAEYLNDFGISLNLYLWRWRVDLEEEIRQRNIKIENQLPDSDSERRRAIVLDVLLAIRRDNHAFERLVDRFDKHLLYYVSQMVHDLHLASDIVQETWITAFRTLHQLRDPQAFKSWLYRIAHVQLMKQLKLRYQRREIYEPTCDVPEHDVDESELMAEQATMIHDSLGKLAPTQREILLLRFMEDFSINDIARALEVPEGTVKSRLYHAKIALKHILSLSREGNP